MPKTAKPQKNIPMDSYLKYAVNFRVLAKVVDGKLLCATRVIANTLEGIDSWREFDSIESAAKELGVPVPKYFGCKIIDDDNPPINWREFKGLYFLS